jgi:hypothetical protein
MSDTVKDYAPRPACLKTDSENVFTLLSRKYIHVKTNYYRAHAAEIKTKHNDRYQNDPVYRESCINRAKASNLRKKERLALLKERTLNGEV